MVKSYFRLILIIKALYYGENDSFLDQSNVFAYIIFIFALLNISNENCLLQTIMISRYLTDMGTEEEELNKMMEGKSNEKYVYYD